MAPGLAAAAYVLGSSERTVEQWCERHGRPPGVRFQLRRNRCARFREARTATAVDLGIGAARAVLQVSPAPAEQIGLVLHAHTQLTSIAPPPASTARLIADAVGLHGCEAFSLCQANCVSLLYAMRVATTLMAARQDLAAVLIVGADRTYGDSMRAMGVTAMVSDAATAVILSRESVAAELLAVETGTDGLFPKGVADDAEHDHDIRYMELTVSTIRRALAKAAIGVDRVHRVFPHNINLRGWHANLRTLGIGRERLYDANFERIGHAFVCDTIINLVDGAPAAPAGEIALLHSNGVCGWSGSAVLRLLAPLPAATIDFPT